MERISVGDLESMKRSGVVGCRVRSRDCLYTPITKAYQ